MNAFAHRHRRLFSSLGLLLLAALLTIVAACSPASAPLATPTPTSTPARPTPVSTPRPVATITPAEVRALSDQIAIFDARSREEYAAGHLPGAVSLPLGELTRRLNEVPRDRTVVFYCSGST